MTIGAGELPRIYLSWRSVGPVGAIHVSGVAFENRPPGRLPRSGAIDAAPAQRNILFGAACFGRCAARDPGKPLNLHAPGQRSLNVMENRGRGGVWCEIGASATSVGPETPLFPVNPHPAYHRASASLSRR